MATTSTIPAVKSALVTLIAAGAGVTVQVKYGRPQDSMLASEVIFVGDVRGTQRVPTIRNGRRPREENYAVEIVVAVLKARGEITDAETRAFALLAYVEDVVANDSTLGGVNGLVHAIPDGAIEVTADQTAEGPACLIRFEVQCLARLA